MRRAWIALVLAACGAASVSAPVQPRPAVPRLAAPPLLDADARGAAYLTAVALSLQPAWHQFLEDCRLRLPARHALNEMSLVAVLELEVDKRGHVLGVRLTSSGNGDFDRAANQVVIDSAPLPPPPRALWSDDDHVHLAWTFARDRRQAGPATARIIDVELPLRAVLERLIGERDLSRAAQRILRAKPSAERDHATQRLLHAALRESLSVSDGAVRRAAVAAIGRAGVSELAADVRQLLGATSDGGLRLTAIETAAALRDARAVDILVEQLRADLKEQTRLAIAEARALVALGHDRTVKTLLAEQLAITPPNLTALHVLAHAPVDTLALALARWFRSPQARVRAAVCNALVGYPGDVAWPMIGRGLGDRDANVRAACVAAASVVGAPINDGSAVRARRTAVHRLRALATDRDSMVRARAVTALAALDPARMPDASSDPAGEVRAAYAAALGSRAAAPRDVASPRDVAAPREGTAQLRTLADDRDPDVRAAAWRSLTAGKPDAERRALATRAATDTAEQVRFAAIRAIEDDELLLRIATHDDAADVRTEALVELVGRRGRAASAELVLQRFAEAAPGSGERVRTPLAWLLAR